MIVILECVSLTLMSKSALGVNSQVSAYLSKARFWTKNSIELSLDTIGISLETSDKQEPGGMVERTGRVTHFSVGNHWCDGSTLTIWSAVRNASAERVSVGLAVPTVGNVPLPTR